MGNQSLNMRFLNLFSLIIILFSSCKDKIPEIKPEYLEVNKENLQGTWQNRTSNSPDFEIVGDSMLFLQGDQPKAFPYQLVKDSLIIYFKSFDYSYRVILFKSDSLHLLDEQNLNTFLRVKK